MKRNLSLALVSAFLIISGLHLLVYSVAQQVHRQSANESPRLLLQLLSASLDTARNPGSVFNSELSAASRITGAQAFVCDGEGKIIAGRAPSGIDGMPTHLPKGLASGVLRNGAQFVTWAPASGRFALALRPVGNKGWVAATYQPLYYTETKVMKVWQMVVLSWIVCTLSLAFAGAMLFRRLTVFWPQRTAVLA